MKNIKKANVKAYLENDELYIMIDDDNKTFDEKYKFHFTKDSYIGKLYSKTSLNHIEDLYDGGTFIVEDGNIVDFRDGNYDSYCNTKVKKISEILGYEKDVNEMTLASLNYRIPNNNYILGKQYNKVDLIVNDIEYETGLWYIYNPFMNHIKMIPYIKNDDGMFCWHNKTVQYRYNKKYIDKILETLPYKKSYNTFINGQEYWESNLYEYKLSLEVNEMFKELLTSMDTDVLDEMLDDYEDVSGKDVEEYITCFKLFNMYLKLLTVNENYSIIFKNISEIIEKY